MTKARFGQFEVDFDSRELRKAGIRIKVNEQPFQVLEALLQRPGEIVTRDELRRRMWPDATFVDFDQSLNKAVNRLRAALSDNAANPRFIETLSRRGYRLLVSVEPCEGHASTPAVPVSSEAAPSQPHYRRWVLACFLVGAVVVAGAISPWFRGRRAQIESIVVLPLTNLSGDPGEEYFVDGMTDSITTELAKIPGLRVVSTTSAMHYKAAKKPLPVIARELRVDGAIEGTLRRTGNRVRMSLKLVEAASDRPLWIESYETDIEDIARVQTDVVRLVASAMRTATNPASPRQLANVRRIDPRALDEYLRGYALSQQRTEPALKQAMEHFRQAIAIDPGYARAYVGLAAAYQFLAAGHIRHAKECYEQQVIFAAKALELDNTIPEAHLLLGIAKLYGDWDWAGAEPHYKRALDSSYGVGHQRYALALMWLGRFDEALAHIRRAQEIDPLATVNVLNEGEIYYYARQYDPAIEHCRRAIDRDPKRFMPYQYLGLGYSAKGMHDEAVIALQTAVSLGAGLAGKSRLGYVLARAGRVDEAIRIVRELESMGPSYPYAFHVAVVYAGLGDKRQAFRWLEKSYQERSRTMVYLGVTPELDGLRSDPRFSDLVRRVGIAR